MNRGVSRQQFVRARVWISVFRARVDGASGCLGLGPRGPPEPGRRCRAWPVALCPHAAVGGFTSVVVVLHNWRSGIVPRGAALL